MKKLKFGLLGCSQISITSIINIAKKSNAVEVYGCAARDYKKAKKFSEAYNIPYVFKNYMELLENPEIDVVYISLANSLHYQWTIEAIKHKKHILVEKPMCMSYQEALEIAELVKKYNIVLLEGIMVQHHDWQKEIKNIVKSYKYGDLEKVSTEISFMPSDNFSGNYRQMLSMGGGCFWDLGSYWIQFLQYILGSNCKINSAESKFDGPNGCDWDFQAELLYDEKISAELSASFNKSYHASHTLIFQEGVVEIKDFFRCKYNNLKFIVHEMDLRNGETDRIIFPKENFYTNQINFLYDVINKRRKNINIEETLERIKIMEKIYIMAND